MKKVLCAAAAIFTASLATNAGAVPVTTFTGSYDEATGVEAAGDYDNIGGLLEVGDFSLLAGANIFMGSIFTPNDSSDFFNLVIGANQTLVSATITFAENATDFDPYIFRPPPQWTLQESSPTPVIFDVLMGPNSNGYAYAPLNFTAPAFSLSAGIYGLLIGNGTFGMNNGGGVDYTMTFNVVETPSEVPIPAALPLLLGGLGLLKLSGIRRRKLASS